MNAYEVYKMYVALKLHFTSDTYDYIKFNGKVKTTESKFNLRKDKYFFQKLCNKYDRDMVRDYFVSNFVYDTNTWVGSITEQRGEKIYSEWKRKIDSISYLVLNEVDDLLNEVESFDQLFEVKEGQHPILLKRYLAKKVSIETMIILDEMLGYVKNFDKQITEQLFWPNIKKVMVKYRPLLSVNTTKIKFSLKEKILCHFSTPQ